MYIAHGPKMDLEKLIFSEKLSVAITKIREKCSVITFTFTLIVFVVIVIMFATVNHRLEKIENKGRSDVRSLFQKLNHNEAKIELFKGKTS